MEMAEQVDGTGRPTAVPPGDFLALMGAIKGIRNDIRDDIDEKMKAQSAGIRDDIDEKMKAQSAGIRDEMKAQSADIRNDLVALEGQLRRSLIEELGPLKKKISELSDNQRELFESQKRLQQEIDDLKAGRARTTSARSGVPVSVPEEIDRVLNELDPANPAANDPRLVEKVLARSREVKLKNFRCTHGMPEDPQLVLGDGNVLAVRRVGNIFESIDDVLDAVEFFMQILVVAGKVPVAAATAYKRNVRAHRFAISSPDVLAEAHDRFRLKLIQKSSWEFAEGFPPAMAKEFEVICQGQKQVGGRFYSEPGTMGRSGPFRGKCLDGAG